METNGGMRKGGGVSQYDQSACEKAINSLFGIIYSNKVHCGGKKEFQYKRTPSSLETSVIIRLPENMWEDFVRGGLSSEKILKRNLSLLPAWVVSILRNGNIKDVSLYKRDYDGAQFHFDRQVVPWIPILVGQVVLGFPLVKQEK